MSMNKTGSWVCVVCGYVHHGDEPPDVCPLCGATSDFFEPHDEPQPEVKKKKISRWQCLNCDFISEGDRPPEICPVCGAPMENFEPLEEAPQIIGQTAEKRKIVIAGAGIAGISAAESIRKVSPSAEIILLSKEPDYPYYRLNLTRYLAGEIDRNGLALHTPGWYEEQNITLLRNTELCSVDLEKKELLLRDKRVIDYESLVLTAGSHPFVPPIPGVKKENVFVMRTSSDADAILEACSPGVRCICIGGGILGLETAAALASRGVDVSILEGYGWLLPRQLNQKAGELLEIHARSLGINLRNSARTEEILGDERVREVLLEDGSKLPAEMVVISAGIRPNSYLARLAGLDVQQGVVVDNTMNTSDPHVFAAGDIAQHRGIIYGTWSPSQFQGATAGLNAAGTASEFGGIPRTNMLKVLNYDLFSAGTINAEDASFRIIDSEPGETYYYFVFRDNRMVGAILMGDPSLSGMVKTYVENRKDCADILKLKPSANDIVSYLGG